MLITITGLKIALATAVGSLAIGGVAAAATGSLPGPLDVFGQPAASGSVQPTGSDEPTDSASATGSTGEPTADPSATDSSLPGAGPSATGSASATWTPTRGPNPLGADAWGLCHAFGNKTWGNAGQSTGTPNPAGRKPANPSVAYANLVAAAASQGLTVDQFCTVVLAGGTTTPSGGTSQAHPSGHGHSSGTHGHGHGNGNG